MHNMLTDPVPLTFAGDNKYAQLILWLTVTVCRYCFEVAAGSVKSKATVIVMTFCTMEFYRLSVMQNS